MCLCVSIYQQSRTQQQQQQQAATQTATASSNADSSPGDLVVDVTVEFNCPGPLVAFEFFAGGNLVLQSLTPHSNSRNGSCTLCSSLFSLSAHSNIASNTYSKQQHHAEARIDTDTVSVGVLKPYHHRGFFWMHVFVLLAWLD